MRTSIDKHDVDEADGDNRDNHGPLAPIGTYTVLSPARSQANGLSTDAAQTLFRYSNVTPSLLEAASRPKKLPILRLHLSETGPCTALALQNSQTAFALQLGQF